MGDGRSLPPSDFEGSSLEQMRNWVHGGTGAETLFNNAESWRGEQRFMKELSERVKARMAKAHAVIEGRSGDAMQNAVAPVVLWAEVSADNAQAQAQRMQDQGEAFNKVQSSIPKQGEEQHPPEDNWLESAWSSVGGGRTDNEIATQHNEKLRQEAVTAFQGYDNTSQSNVSSSAVFTAPPQAGQNTTVAAHAGPQAGGIDMGGMSSGRHAAGTHSSSVGGVGGDSAGAGGSVPGHAAGSGPASSSPSGSSPAPSSPAGAQPAPPQAWQRGTLDPPRTQQQGGGMGVSGGVPAGGGAGGSRGSTGGSGGGSRGGSGAGGRGSGGGGRDSLNPGGSAGGSRPGASGGANSAGSRGGASGGAGGGGARGAGQQGEDEEEHYSPEFLKGDYGFFDEDMPRVAPAVFGDDDGSQRD